MYLHHSCSLPLRCLSSWPRPEENQHLLNQNSDFVPSLRTSTRDSQSHLCFLRTGSYSLDRIPHLFLSHRLFKSSPSRRESRTLAGIDHQSSKPPGCFNSSRTNRSGRALSLVLRLAEWHRSRGSQRGTNIADTCNYRKTAGGRWPDVLGTGKVRRDPAVRVGAPSNTHHVWRQCLQLVGF